MEAIKNCYVYVFLNNLKRGKYEYNDIGICFYYEPYYVGISNYDTLNKREDVHIKYAKLGNDVCNNNYKMNIINKILSKSQEPIYTTIFDNLTIDESRNIEKLIIKKIGNRYDKSGPLVNISSGGDGGDTFTNNPRKEKIREKHRQNALGENNNMYGRPLHKNPSHIAKLKGNHWNKGRKASEELKDKFSKMRIGHKNNNSKKALLFTNKLDFIKGYECCKYLAEDIEASVGSCQQTARRNSQKEFPYHATNEYIIIYEKDWVTKFIGKVSDIKKFLNSLKKNKNQYSKK